jgi:hypothetical protein
MIAKGVKPFQTARPGGLALSAHRLQSLRVGSDVREGIPSQVSFEDVLVRERQLHVAHWRQRRERAAAHPKDGAIAERSESPAELGGLARDLALGTLKLHDRRACEAAGQS